MSIADEIKRQLDHKAESIRRDFSEWVPLDYLFEFVALRDAHDKTGKLFHILDVRCVVEVGEGRDIVIDAETVSYPIPDGSKGFASFLQSCAPGLFLAIRYCGKVKTKAGYMAHSFVWDTFRLPTAVNIIRKPSEAPLEPPPF